MTERITPDELRFLAECAEKELARGVATKGDLMALDLRDARAENAKLWQFLLEWQQAFAGTLVDRCKVAAAVSKWLFEREKKEKSNG